MKTVLFVGLVLLGSATIHAQHPFGDVTLAQVAGPPGGGASCNTVSEATGAATGLAAYCVATGREWAGYSFRVTNAVTSCSISLGLQLGTAGSASVYVSIYSDNAGVPGSIIGSETGPITLSSLTAGVIVTNKYSFSSTLSAGTTNWIVFRGSGVTGSTYVYPAVASASGAGPYNAVKFSSDGTSWSGSTTHFTLYHILWKE